MKRFLLLIFFPVFLVSCSSSDNYSKLLQRLSTQTSIDDKILYNSFNQKFILYNTKSCQIIYSPDIENYHQYSFFTKSNYYTVGHSLKNNFKVVKLENNKISTVFEFNDPEHFGIFPLATDGEHNFFIRCTYNNDAAEINNTRALVLLDANNKLIEYENVHGLISYGAILDNILYYTVYSENKNKYVLYAINIDNTSDRPKIIDNNLESGNIYAYNNKILKTTKDKIYCTDEEFDKCSANYFDDIHHVLIQIKVDNEADLVLQITDCLTKKIIKTIKRPVDFYIDNDELTVYCIGGIQKMKLTR